MPTNIGDALDAGTTVWLRVGPVDARSLGDLSDRLWSALAEQVEGVEGVEVRRNGIVELAAGDDTITLTPGGDGAFEDFANAARAGSVDEWFDRQRILDVGFDLGLGEVRIA